MSFPGTLRRLAVVALTVGAAATALAGCGGNPVSFSPAGESGKSPGVQVSAPGVEISGGAGGAKVVAPGVSISGGSQGAEVSVDPGAVPGAGGDAPVTTGGTVTPGSIDDKVVVTVDDSAATTADEREVATVFRRYLAVAARASHHDKVTTAEIGAVASGTVVTDVLNNLDSPTRTVGTLDAQVVEVVVDASSAQVVSCMSGRSREVDRRNRVVEVNNEASQVDVDLDRVGRGWRIVKIQANAQGTSCG